MVLAALKAMRISYGLFWIALVITTGGLGCATMLRCDSLCGRGELGGDRDMEVALEADRNAQVGIPGAPPKAVQTAPHTAVRDEMA